MSLTLRIFLSLVAGLATGAALAAFAAPDTATTIGDVLAPIGGLWLDALQMVVIPLVIGLLFTGIADAAGTARTSRLAGRALLLFATLIAATAIFGAVFVPWLLSVWPASLDAAQAIIGSKAAPPAATSLDLGAWLRSFITTNPFKALAEANMLQLVVFTGLFALAATKLPDDQRKALVGVFNGLTGAMLTLVNWVLWLGPIGVFALSAQVGIRAGLDAIGVLAHYVAVVSLTQIILIVALYGLAFFTRTGLIGFARGVLPAQVVAVSTQSSIASLPAMVTAATGPLRVPAPVAKLVLPMAVAVFRYTSAPANLAVALYVAHLNGMQLDLATLVAGAAVAFAVSVAAVGLPGQVSFITSVGPICIAMGIPLEALPLLIAVEMLPDIFRTFGNVTADVAATAVLARNEPPDHEKLDNEPI